MSPRLRSRAGTGGGNAATVLLGAAALVLAVAACGEPASDSGEPAEEKLGEELVAVAGYDYAGSQGDPTVAAVVDAYESYDLLPPPAAVAEEFESGAGPFWQGSDDAGSVAVTDGALRITNSDPEFGIDSYAELDTAADSVFVATGFTITEPLQAYEGPALAISRWEAEELDLEYEFTVDGETAYLFETTGPDPDDMRLLDSAAVTVAPTDEVGMALWVYSRGESSGIIGWLGDEPIVSVDGASGSFDSVALRVFSTGTPRTVDFAWAGIGALSAGEALPELFADQSEYAVQQEGTQVATIAVLEPSEYLAQMPQFDTEDCCSVLEETAPPGMTVRPEDVAGESVAQGELDGITFWVWTLEDSWNVVTAEDPAAGRAFVEAYITAGSTVIEVDYAAMPDGALETSAEGTTQVLDGALIIAPSKQGEPMVESWPLPAAAQSVTLTAVWGAPSGPGEPVGKWMLEVWGRDPGAGVWLACWSDSTPVELIDMASRQVLATAVEGECGSLQSMTLTIDNSADAPYSFISFQGGDSQVTAFIGDTRYPLDQAGYRVSAEEAGFSVALESLTIEVE